MIKRATRIISIAPASCLLFLTLALLLLMTAAPGHSSEAQGRSAKFDPDGYFMLVGNPPAGLKEFDGFSLLRKPGGGHYPASGVRTNRNVIYRFIPASTNVTRQKFTFTTRALKGTSYSFEGRWLKGGVFYEADLDMDTPVLEGHLIKYRNGQKIAEADLKFSFFAGT